LNRPVLLRQLWVRAFLVLLFVCLPLVRPVLAAENPLQTVFVLHSYHRGDKWTDDQGAGIESALKGSVDRNRIYVEYMDAGRVTFEGGLDRLYRFYRDKYRGVDFDVVCVTDSDALEFMLKYRDRLFPRTPVVFSGVNWDEKNRLRNARGFTGVSAEPDLKANIELCLRLHPGTKNVIFINEWTNKGRLLHENLVRVMPLFADRLRFRLLEDVDAKEVFGVIGSASRDTVVLYGVFGRDKVGRVFDHGEIIELLSRNSVAPIYSPWDFNLGQGIVGGVVTSGYSQGLAAGQRALQLIRGARIENMSRVTGPSHQYMFDYNQMKRYGVRRGLLPPGSVVVNYPESFYERNRTYVLSVSAIIAVLLLIISFLLFIIHIRRRGERELKASRERLRALTWRLTEVEDKARKDLSRELHDQVGQNLTILGVNLNLLKSLITDEQPELVKSRIRDSVAMVKHTTRIIRNVMGDLRSPVLDDYGLVAAIEHYVRQYAERTGIAVNVKGEMDGPRIDPAQENGLLRIVQEALTNVVKHAGATEVIVSVRHIDGRLRLSIEDNGSGFDPERIAGTDGTRGWGMATMRERALAVGGTFHVRSLPGLGTHIIVEVKE
jgi:signal transduction histidine kinase